MVVEAVAVEASAVAEAVASAVVAVAVVASAAVSELLWDPLNLLLVDNHIDLFMLTCL